MRRRAGDGSLSTGCWACPYIRERGIFPVPVPVPGVWEASPSALPRRESGTGTGTGESREFWNGP